MIQKPLRLCKHVHTYAHARSGTCVLCTQGPAPSRSWCPGKDLVGQEQPLSGPALRSALLVWVGGEGRAIEKVSALAQCRRPAQGPGSPQSHACLTVPASPRPPLAAWLPGPAREVGTGTGGGCTSVQAPGGGLSCDSLGQCISPAAGPSARWSLQQGEKNLTRHFKPISRRASGEPQRAPDNPICCE